MKPTMPMPLNSFDLPDDVEDLANETSGHSTPRQSSSSYSFFKQEQSLFESTHIPSLYSFPNDPVKSKWHELSLSEVNHLLINCNDWLIHYLDCSREEMPMELSLNTRKVLFNINRLSECNRDYRPLRKQIGLPFWSLRAINFPVQNLLNSIAAECIDVTDPQFHTINPMMQLYCFCLLQKLLASNLKLPALNFLTVHRLFVALFQCAIKYCLDDYIDYSKRTNFCRTQLEIMEWSILDLLEWKLFPVLSPQEMVEKLCQIKSPSWKELRDWGASSNRFYEGCKQFFSRVDYFPSEFEVVDEFGEGESNLLGRSF